jgi:hypothetical protein
MYVTFVGSELKVTHRRHVARFRLIYKKSHETADNLLTYLNNTVLTQCYNSSLIFSTKMRHKEIFKTPPFFKFTFFWEMSPGYSLICHFSERNNDSFFMVVSKK